MVLVETKKGLNMRKTGKTVPYRQMSDVFKAMAYLDDYCDPTYALIFRVTVLTGLRISDVLSLKYSTHLKGADIVIVESKQKKGAEAKARLKALANAREHATAACETRGEVLALMRTKPKNIYPLLPDDIKKSADAEIAERIAALKHNKKVCPLPDYLVAQLEARQKKYKAVDGGFIFASETLKYKHYTKGAHPINRTTVWKIFSKIADECGFDFNTAVHQLRKTFSVMLHQSTGNNGALVVKTMGWADDSYLQTYLDIENDKPNAAVNELHANTMDLSPQRQNKKKA